MPDTLQPALAAWLSAQEGRTVTVDDLTVASTGRGGSTPCSRRVRTARRSASP